MRSRVFPMVALIAALAVYALTTLMAERSVEEAVRREAADDAMHWGVHMSAHLPDLSVLMTTGRPNEAQMSAIREVRELGNIFRFKLFDTQGRLVLISDEGFIANADGIASDIDLKPRQVIRSGETIVKVVDGRDKPDRPNLYAEAYVPLTDEHGILFGVANVYINETNTQQYFHDAFQSFGLVIAIACALLFLGPAWGFILQRELTRRTQQEVEYLARFDSLTGLLNRAAFTDSVNSLIERDELSALLFLDADRFKVINDTYGHAIGDEYLMKIGRILTANTDPKDVVARFGGDEFVVAVSRADQDLIYKRVRKIVSSCAEPLNIAGHTILGSVSIGVALHKPCTTLDDTLANSDAALYVAKSSGRNQFALYGDEMGAKIQRKRMLEDRLRSATADDEFTIEYQPLVDGKSHQVFGYEALLRLQDHNGIPIPPCEFISVAEGMGLIEQIGSWTLRQATKDILDVDGAPYVAVNLSAAQFNSGLLPQVVQDALTESGLPPARLELEITESLLLGNDPSIAMQMGLLREMGIKIAMDDFGTGFSSLGYLWQYGFDRLKIDRSFISGLEEQADRSLEIIETVVLLGKRLGMAITAEGVETPKQSEILSKLGCDVLQGYLFGRPNQLPAYERRVHSHN